MRRLSNPQIGFLVAFLCAAALGMNGYSYWRTGHLDALMLMPTAGLLAILVALPFMSGWRPNAALKGHVACASCHTLWDPKVDGTAFCPGCGKVPKGAPTSFVKHPYASPLRR